MNNKRDCKIIQEYLLPSYIENLTDNEINQYIEEHIKNCNDCKETLQKMKKDVPTKKEESKKREVKYMHKFNKKLKIAKTISIIIIAIILIILGSTARKMIILNKLAKKAETYYKYDNIYVLISGDLNNGSEYMEHYQKDGIIKRFMKSDTGETYITTISTPNDHQNYISTPEWKKGSIEKEQIEDTSKSIISGEYDFYTRKSLKDKFVTAFFVKIDSKTVDGKKCYAVNFWGGDISPQGKKDIICYEKDTGLKTRYIYYENDKEKTIEYTYKFNKVTDEDIKVPNENEYEMEIYE